MLLKEGTILSGRYKIAQKIGSGGMAIVYRGLDTRLGRYVTIKVLREDLLTEEEFKDRFIVEAQAAASLSHPNIVNVYDVGREEGAVNDIYYIVMEYIDGETLKDLINNKAPFNTVTTLSIAIQIASALQHAHKNKVIHRDIKPQNILVARDGTIKVTDFGIARAVTASTVTITPGTMGSVHYFSPEQARGGYVDDKSDIYSLGIVMFEMATKTLPYEGDSTVSVALKHLNDELPSITDLNLNVSKSLEAIIKNATQKQPSQRYADIESLYQDLRMAFANPDGNLIREIKEIKELESSPTVKISEEEIRIIRGAEKTQEQYNTGIKIEEIELLYHGKNNVQRVPAHAVKTEKKEESFDKAQERKIVIAAVLTALAIIAVIVVIGFNFIKNAPPKPVTVPGLTGLDAEAAFTEMEKLNLILEKQEVYSSEFEEGLIISQSEAEGSELNPGETIRVTVSKGREKAILPDTVNKEEGDALDTLTDAGFKVQREYAHSDNVTSGIVISQQPSGQSEVEKGSGVTIVISIGPENKIVTVPNVEGETESRAIRLLEESGLVVGNKASLESETVPRGNVITQTVRAGTQVNKDTVVGLVISSGRPVSIQSGNTQSKSYAFPVNPTNISPDAQTVQVRIIRIAQPSASGVVVYDSSHNISDFPFTHSITGDENSIYRFQLYVDNKYQYEEVVNFAERD